MSCFRFLSVSKRVFGAVLLAQVVVMAAVVAVGAGPAEAAPAISVSQATNLIDGDVVEVSGLETFQSETIGISQCLASTDFTDVLSAAPTCSFPDLMSPNVATANFTVKVVFAAALGPSFDCRVVDCVVSVAGDLTDLFNFPPVTENSVAPITFNPFRLDVDVDGAANLLDGDVVNVSSSGLTGVGGVEVVQCAGVPSEDRPIETCERQPVTVASDGTVSTPFTVSRWLLGVGPSPFDCSVGGCSVGLNVVGVPGAPSAVFRTLVYINVVGDDGYFAVSPTSMLTAGQTVSIDSVGYLDAEPGAVAFTMQCAFKGSLGNFHCGPVSAGVLSFDGTYHDEIVVAASFESRGETITCNLGGRCLLVTLVLGPGFVVIDGIATAVDFTISRN